MSKIIIKSDFDVSTTMRYVKRFHAKQTIILIFLSNVVVRRLNKNGLVDKCLKVIF